MVKLYTVKPIKWFNESDSDNEVVDWVSSFTGDYTYVFNNFMQTIDEIKSKKEPSKNPRLWKIYFSDSRRDELIEGINSIEEAIKFSNKEFTQWISPYLEEVIQ